MIANWTTATIAQLTEKVGSGATPRGGGTAYKASGTPLIRSMNVVFFGFKREGLAFIDEYQAAALDGATVRANDLLLNITGASIGRVTLAPQDMDGARVNQHVCIIRPNLCIDSRYLRAYLSGPALQSKIWADNTGTTRQALTKQQILGFKVPLAPLAEQRRIADKLDTLLARIDMVYDGLARVAPLLKRFRQSVLAAATSGRLTEDWRGTVESGWPVERADAVCTKVQSGGTPKAGFVDAGIPFLKVYNIVKQNVDFDYKAQFVTREVHEGELKKSQVFPGDVLMNIVGPPLGKVAVVPANHLQWNINQAITLFRSSDRVSSAWLNIVLCEGAPIREVLVSTKGSVGQVNISLSQCRAFEFPVPPPLEQAEIVRRVERLFTYADRIETRLESSRIAADRLTPAMLAKAFRGELVPQDPNDEPASVLLQCHQPAANSGAARRSSKGGK